MKFVVAGYGSRGDVEPCIAVAGELLRRGHDVRMAVTVPPEMLGFVESAGLTAIPYGRDWQALLRDEDFVRMMQNPSRSLFQSIEHIAQVFEDKSTTLLSAADGADLLLAGITEQGLAANVAEYYGIPPTRHRWFQTCARYLARNASLGPVRLPPLMTKAAESVASAADLLEDAARPQDATGHRAD